MFVAGGDSNGDGIVVLKAESGGLTPVSCVSYAVTTDCPIDATQLATVSGSKITDPSGDPTCTVTLNGDRNVTAAFSTAPLSATQYAWSNIVGTLPTYTPGPTVGP